MKKYLAVSGVSFAAGALLPSTANKLVDVLCWLAVVGIVYWLTDMVEAVDRRAAEAETEEVVEEFAPMNEVW